MKGLVFVALVVLAGSGVGYAQSDPAKDRTLLMRSMNQEAYGPLREIIRGQRQYDAALVQRAYDVAEAGLKRASNLWPPNTPSDPKSRYASSPKVWQSRADFDHKISEARMIFANTRSQAASGVDGLKAAWPQVDSACNSCHETYRIRQQ